MKRITLVLSALFGVYAASVCSAEAAVMNDYCIKPPFVSQVVPPLVMFETGRDHKLFYQAYNDAIDIDEDGQIDSKYKHSIQYYGYFDAFKCYTHSNGSGNTDKFTPIRVSNSKFCGAGEWSGNVLNWLSMSRADVLRRVLYGGQRNTDSGTATTLLRSFIPQDAHSWGKELTGRLCFDNGAGTYSYTCSTSADCKSGDTCVDKSIELIGIPAADQPSTCAASVAVPAYSTAGKIFVARYQALDQNNSPRTGICGDYTYTYDPVTNQSTERDDIYLSYFNWNTVTDGPINDSLNLLSYYYIPDFDYKSLPTVKLDVDPLKDHVNNFNFFAAANFTVANADKGDWQFLLDGDDGVELLVDGVVKSIYPGCHQACFQAATTATYPPKNAAVYLPYDAALNPVTICTNTTQSPPTPVTVNLTSGVHRLVVRHRDNTGNDGIRLWFRKGTNNATAWSVFGATALGAANLTAPTITTTNECSIKSTGFISNGTPVIGTAKQHVFCNTSLAANGSPLLRLAKNTPNRMWEWSARERPVCGANFRVNGSDVAANPLDYTVQVSVCVPGLLEENCKGYPIGSATPSSFKPVGLLQKYGDGDNTKVCSKTMNKPCTNDGGCNLATEGLCMYKTGMYFGMASTSYTKNKSGGVIRKNFGSMLDEVNDNQGYVVTAENVSGNIIHSFDRLSVVDFNFTGSNTPSYLANCPFSAGAYGVFTEGTQCRMWGNPVAEMMYESMRYIAGKTTSTTAFDYTTPADAGVSLSHPAWGKFGTGSSTYKPYDIFPTCSRSFLLVLSDINSSYDDDQVPGSSLGSFTEDTGNPQLNINVTTLADTISASEGIDGNQFFVGETTSLQDFVCSAKSVSKLSLIRGICPEEPTKKGSFYAAAVAYYGKNGFRLNTGLPEVNTFVIALSSPIADLRIKAGTSFITMVPVGKSVHGGWTSTIHCLDRCTTSYIDKNADGSVNRGLVLECSNTSPINPTTEAGGAYCPSNQIVNTFVKSIRYDSSNNVVYAKFSINYEDVEMGSDHDMDAIVDYEICTSASNGMAGTSCTTALGSDQIEVKLNSAYAAGGVDQVMGFVISGTGSTTDGLYLPVRDTDSATLSNGYTTAGGKVIKLPTQWQKTFSASTNAAAANFLKNPLWYAAKWGGFIDKNGNNKPDQRSEWAANCTETDINKCDPDNYFLVTNPLRLESQLDRALSDIMRRVTSGTAASILNNSEGSGANLLQAVFYPKKSFDGGTEADWIGELQNLWYFVDPFFNRSTVRVDSNSDFKLDLHQDQIAKFRFDSVQGQTVVDLIQDVKGDGSVLSAPTSYGSDDPNVRSLWRAGRLLWERNLSSDPRKIYTVTTAAAGSSLTLMENNGTFNNNATVMNLLQAATGTEAGAYIDYMKGIDQPALGYRSRAVNISSCGLTDTQGCTREWKLGDIVNSTPRLESSFRLNTYNLEPPSGYGDTSYLQFTKSANYKHRGMAFTGANDGMLHAFKLGILDVAGTTKLHKAQIINADGSQATSASGLGREEWAFVPRNALPYLKYMTTADYGHLYYIDNTVTIFDASINVPTTNDNTKFPSCGASTYWNCEKKTTTDTSGNLDMSNTSWRTILIGGMGLGGATRNATTPASGGGGCDDKTLTGTCVKTPITNVGYSSYFALDVTNPHVLPGTDAANDVKFLWEFNGDPSNNHFLGYTNSGPAVIRVGPKGANGKWFAVFVSGPTGPIDTASHEFLGKSDQRLKIFIVDLVSGTLLRTIDAGAAPYNITNAFGGSISASVSDNDKWNRSSSGFYSDDVVYIGYVQADTTVSPNTWTRGGVLRLLTKENQDPSQWVLSKVIDNVGPVTTAVTKLQDRFAYYDKSKPTAATGKFWLYFGTGRYFYRTDSLLGQSRLFGIEEPCYSNNSGFPAFTATAAANEFDVNCTETVAFSDLLAQNGNATTSAVQTLPLDKRGWYVDLDTSALNDGFSSERVITNPIASIAGAVFFTTFRPTGDICGYGGNSYIWSLKYDSGGEPPPAAMKGKAIMQVSTGALAEISLADAFKSSTNNKRYDNRRLDQPISGMPPSANGLALITNPRPVKKMLHYQEK